MAEGGAGLNILIALAPAFFWGILPLVVSRVGGTPVQQIIGTTVGTLLVSTVVAMILPSCAAEGSRPSSSMYSCCRRYSWA